MTVDACYTYRWLANAADKEEFAKVDLKLNRCLGLDEANCALYTTSIHNTACLMTQSIHYTAAYKSAIGSLKADTYARSLLLLARVLGILLQLHPLCNNNNEPLPAEPEQSRGLQ
eukprot:2917190-Pleurochrysis_carterae.AAC.4